MINSSTTASLANFESLNGGNQDHSLFSSGAEGNLAYMKRGNG